MASYNAANVTKVKAGGSGDNVVKDGYIKTVEKVWIDSYAYTDPASQLQSSSSIIIAQVPRGKKITDVIVHLPVSGGAGTSSSIYCSYATFAPTSGTPSLGTLVCDLQGRTAAISTSAATFQLSGPYIGTLVPTSSTSSDPVDIHITLATTGNATIAGSTGTIKTIVKYT
jgi:hypothetical protein